MQNIMRAGIGLAIVGWASACSITVGGGGGAGGAGGGDVGIMESTGGSGPGAACEVPADCPPTGNPCTVAACVGGVCGAANAPAGTVLWEQTSGDCRKAICDDNGGELSIADDADLPISTNPCAVGTCTDGSPGEASLPSGTACSADGGIKCDGMGSCVACLVNADCGPTTPACSGAHTCGGASLSAWDWGPTGIAVDGTNVYWVRYFGGLMKCAIGGCDNSPTTLSTAAFGPTNVAVDGTYVYWASLDVMQCAASGCDDTPTVLAPGNQPHGIAVDATDVYWTNFGDGTVMRCASAGCDGTPTAIASDQPNPHVITVDADNVYWANWGTDPSYFDGSIVKCSIADCAGTLTTLSTGQAYPAGITVDDTYVYWTSGGTVKRCAIAGCGDSPTTLFSAPEQLAGIAVDATDVYWITAGGGAVRKCAKSGCTGEPTVLAFDTQSGPNGFTNLAVDATNVYWTNYGANSVSQTAK